MLVFDASSMIHAWDNYPPKQFPALWVWIESQISSKAICIPSAAYQEVLEKSPECADFLSRNNIDIIQPNSAILRTALSIKNSLGIKDDKYSSGVGENDILIMATAKVLGYELVSNEGRQLTLPINKKKYKIPAVCGSLNPKIIQIDFIAYIKRSSTIF